MIGKKIIKCYEGEEPTNPSDDSVVFVITQIDSVGRSGSNLWGDVVRDGKRRRGLYKEYNYDLPKAAYCEKLWSSVGKCILKGIRVPDIEIVCDPKYGDGLISYIVLDNSLEDMSLITDILYNNCQREEQHKKRDTFCIKDILDSIRIQVINDENYKKLEKDVIDVILLDAVTNSPDRHPNNWGLVRTKNNDYYELAVFDNAVSFFNMFEHDYMHDYEWFESYLKADGNVMSRCLRGDCGDEIIKYVAEKFPQYFEEFVQTFSDKMPEIEKIVDEENLPIDGERIKSKLRKRAKYLERIIGKGEIYDD